MSLNPKTKNIIIEYFTKKPEVASVYLYGSYARGKAKKDSDIDLGVLVSGKTGYTGFSFPELAFAQELTKLTGKDVEVQDLYSVSIDFAHRVLAEGKLLLSNNEGVRIDFEERVLRVYFDLKPALEEYYRNLSQIAKKGELHVRYP